MSHTTDHKRRQVELFSLLASLDLNGGELSGDEFGVLVDTVVGDSAAYKIGLCETLEAAGILEMHPFSGRVRINPKKLGQAVPLHDTVRTTLRHVAHHSPGVLHG